MPRQEDYDAFCARHAGNQVKTADLSTYEGNCYLGIDAGSTTTKAALVGEDGSLLYHFYSGNNGSPPCHGNPGGQGDQRTASRHRQHRLVLFHRLRRGALKGGADAGRGGG